MTATTPTLAERFDPKPADDARLETAIARRNTTYVAYREAHDLLEAAEARGYLDVSEWVRNLNQAQSDYEWAERDLAYEKARWNTAGVPW